MRQRGEQDRNLLAQLLKAIVANLRRAHRFELRPQMSQQDLMQRPLEQTQPMIGLHQLHKTLAELLILRWAERPQRGQRHIDQRQQGSHIELVHGRHEF